MNPYSPRAAAGLSLQSDLHCHPTTPCTTPLQVTASVALSNEMHAVGHSGVPLGAALALRYRLCGDTSQVCLPPPCAPGPADGLWRHTCFEAFFGLAGDPAYCEFNFSPSGQWAVYQFSDQRQRAASAQTPEPLLQMNRRADGFELLASVPLQLLPVPVAGRAWEMALTAVIETDDGQLSYWALHHPLPPGPDFHHRGGWRAVPDFSHLSLSPGTP